MVVRIYELFLYEWLCYRLSDAGLILFSLPFIITQFYHNIILFIKCWLDTCNLCIYINFNVFAKKQTKIQTMYFFSSWFVWFALFRKKKHTLVGHKVDMLRT